MQYDRRVAPALTAELAAGALRPLVDHAQAKPLRDLQLWAHPGKDPNRARMYVGRSGVLDVEERDGLFRVGTKTAGKYRALGSFNPSWAGQWRSAAALSQQWPNITRYLQDVEQAVHPTFTTGEAVVHAALCAPWDEFAVIDREARIGGVEDAAGEVLESLGAALATAPPGARSWWRKDPAKLGREADLLAVDGQGRVLVIEVKQPKRNSETAWTTVQAVGYAALFAAWARHVGAEAVDVLDGMRAQRAALGLVASPLPAVASPATFVPVVACGPEQPRPHGLERLEIVRDVLRAVPGGNAEQLQAWHVGDSGRMEVLLA